MATPTPRIHVSASLRTAGLNHNQRVSGSSYEPLCPSVAFRHSKFALGADLSHVGSVRFWLVSLKLARHLFSTLGLMSDSQPASTKRAVFLSYASQDVEVVERIAGALRNVGVEVWFDKNELVDGDAWDGKIRQQIKECALFVPVISAATQARGEGYFRLEWKLAVDRSHLMAPDQPFLLPIVIDDTSDAAARVADEFRAVQWTRLPGGETPGKFCERVRKLISGEVGFSPRPPITETAPVLPSPSHRATWLTLVLIGFVIIAALAVWRTLPGPEKTLSSSSVRADGNTETSEARKLSAPVPLAEEKSVVVLPLENLSADPADAFFTEGMHAEIIATLARLPDLKVISRLTAQRFRTVVPPLPELGRKLGVGSVISGSVQRAGRGVRMQLELLRAADESVLWRHTYDRELTQGFAVQDEIASEIARVLQLRTTNGWYSGAKFMTKNPDAYVLFLKARELPSANGPSQATFDEQVRLCEEALRLDPEFMSAASLLSDAYAYRYRFENDRGKRQQVANQAKHWAERASELVPGGAGDGALAVYYYRVERNFALSLKYAESEVRALPGDPNGYNRVASALSEFGRTSEADAAVQRALALDPLHVRALYNHMIWSGELRRVTAFELAAAQSAELGGRNVDFTSIEDFRFRLKGELPKIESSRERSPLAQLRALWYSRRFSEAAQLGQEVWPMTATMREEYRREIAWIHASALRRLGRTPELVDLARQMFGVAEKSSSTEIDDRSLVDAAKMLAEAFANEPDAAIAAGRRFVEYARDPDQTHERWMREAELAKVCALYDHDAECVALLRKLLGVPSGITGPYLRLSPDWDGVRNDPTFQALLTDPKNLEPL